MRCTALGGDDRFGGDLIDSCGALRVLHHLVNVKGDWHMIAISSEGFGVESGDHSSLSAIFFVAAGCGMV